MEIILILSVHTFLNTSYSIRQLVQDTQNTLQICTDPCIHSHTSSVSDRICLSQSTILSLPVLWVSFSSLQSSINIALIASSCFTKSFSLYQDSYGLLKDACSGSMIFLFTLRFFAYVPYLFQSSCPFSSEKQLTVNLQDVTIMSHNAPFISISALSLGDKLFLAAST